MAKYSATRSANWRAIFSAITVLYLVVVFVLPVVLQQFQEQLGFADGLGVFIDNAKLNSLADFIAGIFAPLAFFWLVAAVMIQSDELKLQREEIAENRQVMKEQANASEAQAEFIRVQTELLREQGTANKRIAEANYRATQYDRRLKLHGELANLLEVIGHENECTRDILDQFARIHAQCEYVFSQEIADAIYQSQRNYALAVRAVILRSKIADAEYPDDWLLNWVKDINEEFGLDYAREELIDFLELYCLEQQDFALELLVWGGIFTRMSEETRLESKLFNDLPTDQRSEPAATWGEAS
ncbi:hypothetical protein [Rhizobium terrae]|uniref:hypothetical protein n=1 Tax=Rhizobium terrae TaxID=2171756 RepID=UPI0013C2B457|nr:hypothetical protein [Rhizobium terrae]